MGSKRARCVLDGRAWPRRIHELRLRDHLTGGLQQGAEQQGTSLSDGNQLPMTEKRSVVGIEDECTEGDGRLGHKANIAASKVFGIFSARLQPASLSLELAQIVRPLRLLDPQPTFTVGPRYWRFKR